ncbi:MAG TPA: sugar phosphate isomerase/epimerase family protein [Actinomycetota bacterium]|nr:sugar phosphate isomerase/epimerase family protein [Actinomycetota bacterium]
MPTPRLLFSSAAFFGRSLADTFDLVADAGYGGVEVMVTRDPSSQDAMWMRRLADARGLTIGAIHAPCLLVTRRIWGVDPIAKIERAVEVAAEAEVPVVVMHPPYRWQATYRAWIAEELPDVEERSGVTVAIENMFPVRVGTRDLTFHANQDLADLEGIPHLVLDTSHAAVARHDLIDVRRRFGARLRHVHLSDNLGRGWDNHLPPGEGVLPLDDFLADLAASDYAGSVSLEVDLRRVASDPARLRDVMSSMRERVEGGLARR